MPYNFTPLQYDPSARESQYTTGGDKYFGTVRVSDDHGGWTNDFRELTRPKVYDQRGFLDEQFGGLFDAVNELGASPFVTGNAFYNTPQYTPFGGTRADFTTGGNEFINPQGVTETAPSSFNQQNYLDAQFGHMNDYLGRLGSYFNTMGASPSQMSMQQIVANAPGQQAQGLLPTIGGGGGLTYGGGTSTNNPFPSFGLNTGGWGTAPTSLFGAGANATNT